MAFKILAFLSLQCALSMLAPMQTAYAYDEVNTAENFVCSANFEYGVDSGFAFGKSDNKYFSVVASGTDKTIALKGKENQILKTSVQELTENENFSLCLVVNENTAKVYLNKSSVAAITYVLDDYDGGDFYTIGNSSNVEYFETDTLDGDLFVGGYSVSKVINVTENYSLLDTAQYTVDKGLLTISKEYLKTLESDKTYTFRAVTSLTDLSFNIENDFVGVNANFTVDKIFHGNDAYIELSENVVVNRVTVDTKDIEFTQTDKRIKISKEVLDTIESGEHKVKLYTVKGRPEVKLSLTDKVETFPEIPAEASHFFFWVDIIIFAGLILSYVGYSAYKKMKEDRR